MLTPLQVAGLLFLGNKVLITETVTFSDTSNGQSPLHGSFYKAGKEDGKRKTSQFSCQIVVARKGTACLGKFSFYIYKQIYCSRTSLRKKSYVYLA